MPSSSVSVSKNGKIVSGNGELAIEYRGIDSCPYGRSATDDKEDFSGIVIHHTAPDHDADWYVQYQIDGDPARGGHFGYHFYIAQDGTIIQGAPLTKRTNHIKPSSASQRRTFRRELSNKNALGISCVGAGKPTFSPTTEQTVAVFTLTQALCDELEISYENIVGHGEIQTDRHETEGTDPAERMRQGLFLRVRSQNIALGRTAVTSDDLDDQPIADREQSQTSTLRPASTGRLAAITNYDSENATDGGDENEDSNVVGSERMEVSRDYPLKAAAVSTIGPLIPAAATNSSFTSIARDGLNVRSGPGAEFPIIRSLPFGTEVNLLRREGRWGLIDEVGDGAIDGAVYLAFLDSARTGRELSESQVRIFWSGRNPRGARLYNSSNNPLVDPHLLHAGAEGIGLFESVNPNYRVEIYGPGGGFRTSGSVANHGAQPGTGRGAALDFVIIDLTTGRWLTNHPGSNHQYQGTVGQNAPWYQKLYNEVVRAGSQYYGDFEGKARFGGYFKNGSNAMDTMHIDMRLHAGAAGGTLRNGFNSGQMTAWDIPANYPYVVGRNTQKELMM